MFSSQEKSFSVFFLLEMNTLTVKKFSDFKVDGRAKGISRGGKGQSHKQRGEFF